MPKQFSQVLSMTDEFASVSGDMSGSVMSVLDSEMNFHDDEYDPYGDNLPDYACRFVSRM